MSNDSLFAFIPKIKHYQVIPSEDDPKEYILLLEENGASLGINHTERRLIELCDGRLAVGDIVLRVTNDSSAKVTDIRRLLWDLDRFGFLETSPWEEHKLPESWGYWGTKKQPLARFYYSTIFGGLERSIVKFALQPIVLLLQFIVLASIFVGSFYIQSGEAATIWSETRILIVNQSVALGVLVVLFGILAALFVSTWAGASVISAVHESPVGMALFWQSPFIRLMLDGRPLRLLPIKKAVLAALIPSFKLFGIAALLSLLGAFSEGVRREWLLHLSVAFAITSFCILIPWFSTVISRDILLRLRGDSVFWMTWRAVRKSFQSLFQSTKEKVLHEQLFLWWGVWAIVSLVIILRLAAIMFRADFPILYSHFLQENNALILWVFIIVSSILLIGIAGAVITFVGWLLRELYTEIRLRAFPQQDVNIAVLIPFGMIFLSLLCVLSGVSESSQHVSYFALVVGLSIVVYAGYKLMHEYTGFPFYLHLPVMIVGFLIVWFGALQEYLEIPRHDYMVLAISTWVLIAILITGIFKFTHWMGNSNIPSNSVNKYLGLTILALYIIAIMLHLFLGMGESSVTLIGIELHFILVTVEIVFYLFAIILISKHLKLLPLPAFACSSALAAMLEGFRQIPNPSLFLVCIAFAGGTIVSTYILYAGILKRVSLGWIPKKEIQPVLESQTQSIASALQNGIEQLLPVKSNPSKFECSNDDDIRTLLNTLVKSFGHQTVFSLFNFSAHYLHWKDTQKLTTLIPPSVPIPKLSNWDQEKVISYLRNVPTFMHAGDETKQIASVSRFKFYQKDDRIITQNTKENDLHIIVQGKAAVDVEHTFGQTRIAVMSTGDFVGEIGFLSGSERTATVRALEPVMVISVNREEIDDAMPQTLNSIRQAEAGQSWLQSLHQFNIFREFSPALLSRVSLESQHIHLEVSRTLVMHEGANQSCVAVLLSGDAVLQQDGENTHLQQGSIAGIVETMLKQPVQGVIRAERQSHILLVDHDLFSSALIELLTPKQMLIPVVNQDT